MKQVTGSHSSVQPSAALANPLEPVAFAATAASPREAFGRRRFLQAAGATGLLAYGGAATAQSATSLEGYAQQPSVRAGQSLSFSVRDPAAGAGQTLASFRIVRLAGWVDLTMQQGSVTLRNHVVPADAASAGCRWPAALTLQIPANWPSGMYYAHFAGAAGSWCSVPFVVRPAATAPVQRVLVVVPVSTAQAKNNYGGGSLYDTTSANGRRLGRVSFARPLAERWNYGFDAWQPLLARWLDRRRIRADFCTDLDLHDEPQLLNGPTLMVVAGHHAYWTREARSSFDARVATGLNAALFSGQNMCWQSRLENVATGRVLVCYKDAAVDPDARLAYKTVRWAELGTPEPENSSIGLGSAGSATWLRGDVRPATAFAVQTEHWVFEGTGLTAPFSTFGADLVGPFTDHAALTTSGSGTVVRFREFSSSAFGAPMSATILASANLNAWRDLGAGLTAPLDQLSAEMAIFSRNGGAGTVFNAGTADWVRGLAPELAGLAATVVGRMTQNIITRMASGTHQESADVRSWSGPSGEVLAIGPEPLAVKATYSGTMYAAFRAYVGPVPGAVPVYRYRATDVARNDSKYLLSLRSSYGNGWVADGIAFYAFAEYQPNTLPIYRYHDIDSLNGAWRIWYRTQRTSSFLIFDDLAFYVPVL